MTQQTGTEASGGGSLLGASETPPATPSTPATSPADPAKPADPGSLLADPAKPAEAPKPEQKPAAPEKYEAFQLGEGVEPDEKFLDAVTPVFKDLGLSQEQAQKIMSALGQYAQAEVEASNKAFNDQVEGWRKEIKADPKWEERAVYAKRALNAHPDEKVRQFFMCRGMGDHPLVISMLEYFGRLVSEDSVSDGSGSGGLERSAAEVLYPSMAKK